MAETSEYNMKGLTESRDEKNDQEKFPELVKNPQYKIYTRRWYILAVFCVGTVIQVLVAFTFGPIAESAKLVYGWTNADFGLLMNCGAIANLIFMFPAAYLMDNKGLRISMVISTFFILLGAGLRCISTQYPAAVGLMFVAQILIATAGPVIYAAGPLLSDRWFPPHQRATATAMALNFNMFGAAISFVLGPHVIPSPQDTSRQNISVSNSTTEAVHTLYNLTDSVSLSSIRDPLIRYLYIECGLTGLLFLFVCVYFPSKPPTPPSVSASLERIDYKQAVKDILRHGQLWLVAIAASVPNGVAVSWGSVMAIVLATVNISQEQAGWIGFSATVGAYVFAFAMARFADVCSRRYKEMILSVYILTSVCYLWFNLVMSRVIPFNLASIYASCILAFTFLGGSYPLWYEMAIETSYPTAAGLTSGLLNILASLSGIIFLGVVQIPHTGVAWMNWTELGCVVAVTPLIILLKETHKRTEVDKLEISITPSASVQTKT